MLPEPIQQIDRTWAIWRGQTLAYFAGCDYFRMASHPAVLAAAQAGLTRYGLNVAASRYTTGNHVLYEELEAALAAFFQSESALLIANGYLTNLAVVQGLAGEGTHVLIDERAHASLVDAAVLTNLPITKFRHRELASVRTALGKATRTLLLTDGIFAQDGAIAPIADYRALLPKDSWIIVDDSHAALEFQRPFDPFTVQTLTLSKSIGSFGGAIVSTRELRAKIESKSRAIMGATPLPLPNAAAALASVGLLKNPDFQKRLRANVARVSSERSPILSVVPENEAHRDRLMAALLARGLFPSNIRYQNRDYFRFAISSEHTRAQLDALRDAIGV